MGEDKKLKDVMRSTRAQMALAYALVEDFEAEGLPKGKARASKSIPPIDPTSFLLIPEKTKAKGEIYSKGGGCVVSGTTVARAALMETAKMMSVTGMKVDILIPDGHWANEGEKILEFRGDVHVILAAERTALNFMQRMCAIATLTRRFVDATKEFGTMILDTRKTTPGLRVFEKYAVLCGGGSNHRMGLYDRILMKDNHRRLWRGGNPDELDKAVLAAKKAFRKLDVEIEVESLEECASALRGGPEWIMLDNMSCENMAKCVQMCKGTKTKTEASGGITLDRAREVAATGVTAISLGCLTHSAGSIDLSLEWSEV